MIFQPDFRKCSEYEEKEAREFELEVFVAHQDLATGLRAKETLDNLTRRLHCADRMHPDFWRFELLEDSGLWREAVRNAGHADILFISFHGRQPLSAGVNHWLKQWTLVRGDHPCAVVASLDEQDQNLPAASTTLDFLREVAGICGLEVFPHYGITPDVSLTISRSESDHGDSGIIAEDAAA